ncbi:hypothetical protein AB7C87_12705 [Natrarchaeobius sp. A-rgal3]|uniref:DUF7310 family coiled-coil domain-containing protein n=1 Tax=Natrarchaeobius versutus TaxID=1679078 RepID=UPI00350F350D
MTDIDRLDQRLSALERTVVDDEFDLAELSELTTLAADLDRLETRIEAQEMRIATLEGRTDSVEGYVGRIDAVNDAVETEAATALAVVDRLDRRVADLEHQLEGTSPSKTVDVGSETDVADDERDRARTAESATDGRIERTIAGVVGESHSVATEQATAAHDSLSTDGSVEAGPGQKRTEGRPSDGEAKRASTDPAQRPSNHERAREAETDGGGNGERHERDEPAPDDRSVGADRPDRRTGATDQRTVDRRVPSTSRADSYESTNANARDSRSSRRGRARKFVSAFLSRIR